MEVLLALLVGWLFAAAVYLMLSRSLVRYLFGLVLIGNAANLINPQKVVLGGGVTKAGERWWQIVRETAQQTALPEVTFEIVPAAFTDDAPLWGAVALVEM